MTTTVTNPLQATSPHRIRRIVMEVLAGGVLIASTALVVNRIVDDDSRPVGVQGATETVNRGAAIPLQGLEIGVIGQPPAPAIPLQGLEIGVIGQPPAPAIPLQGLEIGVVGVSGG